MTTTSTAQTSWTSDARRVRTQAVALAIPPAVVAGREYSIDRAFLTAGGMDIDANARVALDGTISNGRLRVARGPRATVLDFALTVAGYTIPMPIRAITFSADLRTTGLDRSSLGGWVLGDDLLPPIDDQTTALVGSVLGGLVDVQVDGVCDDRGMTPERYGAISVGFGVHAVPASISSSVPIADAPEPGMCGSTTTDAGAGG